MPKSVGLTLNQAISLVKIVCDVAGSRDLIEDARTELRQAGVVKAVRQHDDEVIFNWLMEAASYQGISDSVAAGYMEAHGTASAFEIGTSLESSQPCGKLRSYWNFRSCGYRKSNQTCKQQALFRTCPVPRLDLRNGSLNQAAYSLFLFMRDVACRDFVAWIDERLNRTCRSGRDRATALIEPLSHIHGLQAKVLSMSLASLLLAGDPKRHLWRAAGAQMIAIDTLVHNWLHRTGILRGLDAEHAYGAACYSDGNCSDILRRVSSKIDGRAFNVGYPECFPRFVQHAIWRFCARQQLDQCNGNRIDDRRRCNRFSCIAFENCSRLKLGRASKGINI
jgi:hypothetical protein